VVSGASVHHWRNQRLSALALIPLVLWFVSVMIAHLSDGRAQFTAWLSHPAPLLLMTALVLAVLYHMAVGVREVILDYIHAARLQAGAVAAVYLASLALAAVALAALARIGFGT
jgi:succinate dehydrogenase / fumarate reductase membrane anchor subunit